MLLAAIALTSASAAHAATITVDTINDTSVLGQCSLRDAISAANNQMAVNGCIAGTLKNDTIIFQGGVTGTIALGSTLPAIITGETVTIQGPTTSPGITIDGLGAVRLKLVNRVLPSTQFLTLANGNNTGVAGGILNFGTLTVSNSTFSGNGAGGGGIENNGGTLTVTNSTFFGNSAGAGGGIDNFGGSATLKGTILAGSSLGNCGGTGTPPVNDGGYNISDDHSCVFANSPATANGQTIGDGVDPLLASGLASNGGPTETIALLAGSPAIDAIPVASCAVTTDQRGVVRPDAGEGACDIGAYEFVDSFVGQPGTANCHGESVSALAQQFGGLDAAASALGFPSVTVLQAAIREFCTGYR